MMYVLNSDTVKYVLQQRAPVFTRYQMAAKNGATFALCPIVQFEIARILKLKRASNIESMFGDLIRRWQRIEYAAEDGILFRPFGPIQIAQQRSFRTAMCLLP